MTILKTLLLALILAMSVPVALNAIEPAEVKIELADLPAAVTEGFKTEVPDGVITSARKLTGNSTRYQLKYKAEDGKEHQITLGEDGKPTRKKKADDDSK
jgi:hypothetical protein